MGIIVLSVFALTKCISRQKDDAKKKNAYSDFAGPAACINCHKSIYDDHTGTGHYRSSQPASGHDILGSFDSGRNTFHFSTLAKVVMEKRGDEYYQVEYVMEKEKRKSKFDITVGSGKKGQSYLSWKNNSLIQMPATYFAPDSAWTSSPGFHPRRIAFNRVVTSRCLECHSTFAQVTSPKDRHPEEFAKRSIIYGIDCERCHGPAKEHVTFHTDNPGIKEAKYIVNTGNSSRQISLDLCALCHSGRLDKTEPSFSFRAGDSLAEFFKPSVIPFQQGGPDVHGNQLGMLSQSKCFTSSAMTCQSCHHAHRNEESRLDVFSSRCLNCHGESAGSKACGLAKTAGNVINNNCIDCHMPKEPSQSIVVYREGADVPTPAKLRTHHIKIYREEADKILKFLKEGTHQQKQD